MKELVGMQTVNACMLLALHIHRLFSKQLHAVRLYTNFPNIVAKLVANQSQIGKEAVYR